MTRPELPRLISRLSATAAVALCLLLHASPGSAGGAPTFDGSNLAVAKEQVTAIQNQLSQLTEMKSLVESQLAAFGEFGILKDLFGGAAFSKIGSQADFYANLQQFGFDPCAINLCQEGDNPTTMTDLGEARTWVQKNFFAGRPLTPDETKDLQEVRRRGVISFASNALALSTIVHNDLSGAGETAKSLEEIVNSSQNMRGDIRANSAIVLAQYKAQIQQLAMLTAMVDVLAMSELAPTDQYLAGSGTTDAIPDAYIDTDFAKTMNAPRLAVTQPDMGSPSGGSGFGGKLFDAFSSGGSAGILDAVTSGKISNPLGGVTENLLKLDGLSSAASILSGSGQGGLANGLGIVQSGLGAYTSGNVSGGGAGIATGLASILAQSSGNGALQSVLSTGSTIMQSGNAGQINGFMQGAITDLTNAGNLKDANFLKGRLEQFAAGKIDGTTAMMDSMTLLSRNGATANAQVSKILEIDPSSLSQTDISQMIKAALVQAARTSGNSKVAAVASTVDSIDQSTVDSINSGLATRKTK